jgi:hypothetical protein
VAPDGSVANRGSFCMCVCCLDCSDAYLLRGFWPYIARANLPSLVTTPIWRTPTRSPHGWLRYANPNGWSMPNCPSQDPRRCSPILLINVLMRARHQIVMLMLLDPFVQRRKTTLMVCKQTTAVQRNAQNRTLQRPGASVATCAFRILVLAPCFAKASWPRVRTMYGWLKAELWSRPGMRILLARRLRGG